MPEWSSGFPYFLQFNSEFGNKEFMIWATVSFWSCFCWLYRVSPSLAAKNIISLILVLTMWWCPCVESSLVFLEEGVCYDQCVLLAKLYEPLPCFILYSKTKFVCYSRCFLTSYFCIPVPYNEKDVFFGVLVLEGLVGLHRTIHLQLLQRYSLGHRLRLPWYWMVCLGNKQRSFCRFWDCIPGVSCHFLLQGSFSTRGSYLCLLWLLHWQAGSLPLSYLGSPLKRIQTLNSQRSRILK